MQGPETFSFNPKQGQSLTAAPEPSAVTGACGDLGHVSVLRSIRLLICPMGLRITTSFWNFEGINIAKYNSLQKAQKLLVIFLVLGPESIMDPRNKTIPGEVGPGHHLEAGQEVLQVWEGVQTLGLKNTVLVKNVISKEVHIGDLQEAQGEHTGI